ncbi:MAG TPA: HupE/UreJ family protein [Hyphomicrobiaceae bacterium]|nr:HupE/UreJ family protein [Hyphomicrobiaceae bacterium]
MDNRRFSNNLVLAGIFAAAVTLAGPAFAHHAMDGAIPATMAQGLITGVAHPVVGLDHFAFVIAVGLASAFLPGRMLLPLAFIAATIAGCLLKLAGVALPVAEFVIAASVIVVGALVMRGKPVSSSILIGLFAVAGLFHGSAYAAGIIGAEQSPLAAYLAGFAVVQYAVAVAAMLVVREVFKATAALSLETRLGGALVAGAGVAFLVENIEQVLLKAV